MKLWTCRHCRSENDSAAAVCEYCNQPRRGQIRPETPIERPPKPLPSRPAKGTAMYQMALDAAAFISGIPIGLGRACDRESHRQYLLTMAKQYPNVGWEEALLAWDGYCRIQNVPTPTPRRPT